jgi:hypothetical protein
MHVIVPEHYTPLLARHFSDRLVAQIIWGIAVWRQPSTAYYIGVLMAGYDQSYMQLPAGFLLRSAMDPRNQYIDIACKPREARMITRDPHLPGFAQPGDSWHGGRR